jgi:tetratricopeptide (TPR) repeat protein
MCLTPFFVPRRKERSEDADKEPVWKNVTTGTLGQAYAQSGRFDEAARLLQESRSMIQRMRGDVTSSYALQHGQVSLVAGHSAEASELGQQQALLLSRHRWQRGEEAQALRLLGEVAARRDSFQPDVAERHYRQALTLAGELGMRPLVAHCHLGLGKLYRRTGKQQDSQEHLTTATTMYREMDMRFWLEQAERLDGNHEAH